MREAALRSIRSKVSAFPAMPGIASRVLKVLRDPKSSAEAIEEVVHLDPGLTANILRFANSAYVGLRGKVGSLRDAVVQLGIQRLSEMSVAASVNSMMAKSIDGYNIESGEMWRHSLGVAVGAEMLARELRLDVVGDAFTAGLLHDVGKLICGEIVGDLWQELRTAAKTSATFDAAERKVLAVDHAQIGAEILAHWGLPKTLVDAVSHHHRPEELEPGPAQHLTDIVHIADAVALMIGLSGGREGLAYDVSEEAAHRLGLDSMKLESFAARLVPRVREMLEVIGAF